VNKIEMPAYLFHVKHNWKGIAFWLLFPIVMTITILSWTSTWQQETKIPIALVVNEKSEMTNKLVKEIQNSTLLNVTISELDEALYKLRQHELDSVFVIREGYEESVLENRRNGLIDAYSSNRSFAYQAVVEKVTSLVQQDASRSKAAFVIKHLFVERNRSEEWDYDTIIEDSRLKQQEEALLRAEFTFSGETTVSKELHGPFVQVWGIWAFFMIIGAFFLTDWLQKEGRPEIRTRWLFASTSFKKYALQKLSFYLLVVVLMDTCTYFLFSSIYELHESTRMLLSILAFRLIIHILAFLVAGMSKELVMYYLTGLTIALLLTILGGAFIPIDGLLKRWPAFALLSPVHALLGGSVSYFWLGGMLLLLGFWLKRGARNFA
jgi:ABC-2 type transport system permease protein